MLPCLYYFIGNFISSFHIFSVSGTRYHCLSCCKLFDSQPELDDHVCRKPRKHDNNKEKKFTCHICNKMFVKKGHLARHIKAVHEKQAQARYKCSYCAYCTDNSSYLKMHEATHSGVGVYRCPECEYTATHKYQLNSHIYNNHTNQTYKCRYTGCGVRKPSLGELYEHIRSEHPVRRYTCNKCPMSYDTQAYLNRHKVTHEETKPYHCTFCKKGFTQSYTLKRHMLTHSGERPHTCSVCGKGFKQKGTLTSHMKVHTDEKPFSCSYCEKRFKYRSDWQKHERIVCCDACVKNPAN